MCPVLVAPLYFRIARDRVLRRVKRTDFILYRKADRRHIVVRHTVDGHVILVVRIRQRIAEQRTDRQMLVKLPFRRNGEVQIRVLKVILVLGRTVFIDRSRVGQTVVHITNRSQSLVQIVLVVIVKCHVGNLTVGMSIRAQHRAFHQTEIIDGSHRSFIIPFRRTLVFQVTRHVAIRSIEADEQVLEHVDVRIETDIQTVHVIVFQHALRTIVPHRKKIAGYFITTLHRNAIILRKSLTVDDIVPIRIVIILVIVVIIRIGSQELEFRQVRTRCLQQVRSVCLELRTAHHWKRFRQ